MNWEIIEGKWKKLTGAARQKWGELTENDLELIAGKKDALIGKIEEKYGISKEEARRQVENWNPSGEAEPTRERKVS